MKAVFVEMMTN